MSHAPGGGGADFIAIPLDEIDARMKREAAEEGIGPIAERRAYAGVAGKRRPHRNERDQRLEALGGRDVADGLGQRMLEGGRARIDLGRDERAADAARARGGGESGRIEADPGDHRRIARRFALGRAVDDGESLHLAQVHALERTVEEGEARRGIGIVGGG